MSAQLAAAPTPNAARALILQYPPALVPCETTAAASDAPQSNGTASQERVCIESSPIIGADRRGRRGRREERQERGEGEQMSNNARRQQIHPRLLLRTAILTGTECG